jgi:hypothetical protein
MRGLFKDSKDTFGLLRLRLRLGSGDSSTSMAPETPPPPKMMRLCIGLQVEVGRNPNCARQGLLNGCARNSQTGAAAFYFFCCPSCRALISDGSIKMPDASGSDNLSQYIFVP